jgi:hypothetical protein
MSVIQVYSLDNYVIGVVTSIVKSRILLDNGVILTKVIITIDDKNIQISEEDLDWFCVGERCRLEKSKILKYED